MCPNQNNHKEVNLIDAWISTKWGHKLIQMFHYVFSSRTLRNMWCYLGQLMTKCMRFWELFLFNRTLATISCFVYASSKCSGDFINLLICLIHDTDCDINNYSKTCVKRPLKKDKTKILITIGSLMKVESIAESILQYYWPALSDKLSWKPFFDLFESGRFTQILLYIISVETFFKKLCLRSHCAHSSVDQ